jgi:hypothetical protein
MTRWFQRARWKTIMQRSLFFALPICLWPVAALATANVMTTERGFDRPGADFMQQGTANDELCRALCFSKGGEDVPAERRCLAYTFVVSTSVCYLKNAAPTPVPNSDSLSGIHVIVKFGDNGVVYPGHNIPGLDFDTWNPVECQDQCLGDKSCRAWTWVKWCFDYRAWQDRLRASFLTGETMH